MHKINNNRQTLVLQIIMEIKVIICFIMDGRGGSND